MKTLSNSWHLNKIPSSSPRANPSKFLSEKFKRASYIEWKYFNFSAPGVSGIFVYWIADPQNLIGIGGGKVIGRIFAGKKIYGGMVKIPMKNVSPSGKNAAIQMGADNFIKVRGKDYEICGKIGNVAWKLKYSPLLPPIKGFSNMNLDFFGAEKASWEIKMPKARVSGIVKIGGRTIPVRSFGYTDANWGNIAPGMFNFGWAQCNDNKISVVFGEMQGLGIGRKKTGYLSEIFVQYGGKKIRFAKNGVRTVDADLTAIPGTNMKTPCVKLLHAENRDYDLTLDIHALRQDPLEFRMPFSLPLRAATIEQQSFVNGGLFRKSGGSLRLLHKISGPGFMEHTLHKIELGGARRKRGVLV